MLKRKIPLPPEERIFDIGWTDDGRLMLCFKYFEGAAKYDGYFPFSFLNPPLVTLEDLESEIVKNFSTEYTLPGHLLEIHRNSDSQTSSHQ